MHVLRTPAAARPQLPSRHRRRHPAQPTCSAIAYTCGDSSPSGTPLYCAIMRGPYSWRSRLCGLACRHGHGRAHISAAGLMNGGEARAQSLVSGRRRQEGARQPLRGPAGHRLLPARTAAGILP